MCCEFDNHNSSSVLNGFLLPLAILSGLADCLSSLKREVPETSFGTSLLLLILSGCSDTERH